MALTSLLLATLAALPQDAQTSFKPPALEVEGLVGVPMDVLRLEGSIVFDLETETALATAKLVFAVPGDGGMPYFDLRQEIETARLNGTEIDPGKMVAHSLGTEFHSMRILQQELEANREHTLELTYALLTPDSQDAKGVQWSDSGLTWDIWFSDLYLGRYLEQWFPANLIHDQFEFELTLELRNVEDEHQLVTNADVTERGEHHWQLRFPPSYTALSPMVVIVPAREVERSQSVATMEDGRKITIDVCRRLEAGGTLDGIHAQMARELQEFSTSTGPWPHGDRLTVYVWTGGRSMEYDGATTSSTGALRHELFHSWYGRGVKPASQNDGWLDEAWDVYATESRLRFPEERIREEGAPVTLSSADPWNRTTPTASYSAGALFFARVAAEIGDEELRKHMAGFFQAYSPNPASTADLARYLSEATDNPRIARLFHRYVYGRDGDAGSGGSR